MSNFNLKKESEEIIKACFHVYDVEAKHLVFLATYVKGIIDENLEEILGEDYSDDVLDNLYSEAENEVDHLVLEREILFQEMVKMYGPVDDVE